MADTLKIQPGNYAPPAGQPGGGSTAPAGSSGNVSQADLIAQYQVRTGYHTSAGKGKIGPPAPQYHTLSWVLQQPLKGKVFGALNIKDLQQKLIAAGYLDATGYVNGVYDTATQSAYADALVDAHNANMDIAATFKQRIDAGGLVGGSGPARAPFSPQVKSAEEIRAALNDALPGIIGHSVDDAQLSQLTSLYQQLQVSSQRQAYDTNINGGTSTAVQPIDVFAEQQAKKLYPDDYQSRQLANASKIFASAISQGAPDTATF